MIKIANGRLILGDKIESGLNLYIHDGKIFAITPEALPYDEEIDAQGNFVSPGFIDLHVHGGGGGDFSDGTLESFLTAAECHAKGGTTTLLPTVSSTTYDIMAETLDVYCDAVAQGRNAPDMPGIHLEGPYLSLAQAGAMVPGLITPPIKEDYERLLSHRGRIARWTSAPELEGTEEFAKALAKHGVLASVGHSNAEFDETVAAFGMGFTLATHLYSAMSSVHRINAYRHAGVVEAAYYLDGMDVEIIADGKHLPPSLLKLIYKLKGPDRIALITDALRGAGFPEGTEFLSGSRDSAHPVIIEDGVAKLPSRQAFSGSIVTANKLVSNMINLAGVSLCNAVKMATATPARILKLSDRGHLREGLRADIVIFDPDIHVQLTMVGGKPVYSARS